MRRHAAVGRVTEDAAALRQRCQDTPDTGASVPAIGATAAAVTSPPTSDAGSSSARVRIEPIDLPGHRVAKHVRQHVDDRIDIESRRRVVGMRRQDAVLDQAIDGGHHHRRVATGHLVKRWNEIGQSIGTEPRVEISATPARR